MKKGEKLQFDLATILTALCSLVIMTTPFCAFIFHESEEPEGLDAWRQKHDK